MLICEYCNKEFKNNGGKVSHVPYCKLNPTRVIRAKSPNAHAKKGRSPWNKGTQGLYTEDHKQKLKEAATNRKLSDVAKEKLSESAKQRQLGGYVQGSGRGKKGWYKGFYCDSSWELAYLIYCIDHNISIERNTTTRTYVYEGKIRKYIPDFIVDGKLVEIKGYKSAQWKAKHDANTDVIVLFGDDLTLVFEYVHNTYGKDFIKLYGSVA